MDKKQLSGQTFVVTGILAGYSRASAFTPDRTGKKAT